MRLWRLARRKYADLSGLGGLKNSYRWSHVGRPVVYTSTSIALAALEYAVHTAERPLDVVLLEIAAPESSLETIEDRIGGALPQNWSYAELQTRELGSAWLRDKSSLLLEVPSVIIPRERNIILNPSHPEAAAARIVSIEPFFFDPRIFNR